jgi:hypothetical protein
VIYDTKQKTIIEGFVYTSMIVSGHRLSPLISAVSSFTHQALGARGRRRRIYRVAICADFIRKFLRHWRTSHHDLDPIPQPRLDQSFNRRSHTPHGGRQ